MAERLTLEKLKRARVTYIETMYGGEMGIRPVSLAVLMRWHHRKEAGDDIDPIEMNRDLIRESVVDPALDEEALAAIEADARAYQDLVTRIQHLNGLTAEDQRASARSFCAGDSGSEEPS